jgi:hypothetical protein
MNCGHVPRFFGVGIFGIVPNFVPTPHLLHCFQNVRIARVCAEGWLKPFPFRRKVKNAPKGSQVPVESRYLYLRPLPVCHETRDVLRRDLIQGKVR